MQILLQSPQELVLTYLKMKEKTCLITPTYPKTPQNKLSVALWVLSCVFLGVEPETDILSYVIFVTGNTEQMRQFINYLQRW